MKRTFQSLVIASAVLVYSTNSFAGKPASEKICGKITAISSDRNRFVVHLVASGTDVTRETVTAVTATNIQNPIAIAAFQSQLRTCLYLIAVDTIMTIQDIAVGEYDRI